MAITVAQARTSLDLLKRDTSDVTAETFLSWCNIINYELFRTIKGIDVNSIITKHNFSTVPGQAEYPLPADFSSVAQYGCGLMELDANAGLTRTIPLPPSTPNSSNYGYYLANGNIVMTPTPTTTIQMELVYAPEPADLVDSSSEFLIGKEWMRLIRAGLDSLYSQWDEDGASEGLADQRYSRELAEFGKKFRPTPAVYEMPNQSNAFSGNNSVYPDGLCNHNY